ncbi:MAG: hypothetical protein RL385_4263 [Pseudomonadota bacterium]|jgi:hypothetical protein
MTRTTLFALGIAAGTALGGSPLAEAQTGYAVSTGLTVSRLNQAGEIADEVGSPTKLYATVADCEDDVTWQFEGSYGTKVNVVEAWVGIGTTDCSTATNRQRATSTSSATACKLLEGFGAASVSSFKLKIPSDELFLGPGEADESFGCAATKGSPTKTLYILALDQATNVESNLAPAALTLANGYGVLKVTFTPYTVRPNAPSDVKGLVGQSQIGVSFTAEKGNESLGTQYGAYFDFGSSSAAAIGCGTGLLESAAAAAGTGTAAEVVPDLSANELTLRVVKTDGDTATLSNLDGLGIQIGDLTAVAAITIDPAGNFSAPTAPVCVERVKTGGFYALCEADAECRKGLSSCSLQRGLPENGLFAGLSLTGLALGFALRRRRKA